MDKFYYFGLAKAGSSFAFIDAFFIEDNEIKVLYFPEKDFIFIRGISFCNFPNMEEADSFIKKGLLLEKDFQTKNFFLYFLDDENAVLFKINDKEISFIKIKNILCSFFKDVCPKFLEYCAILPEEDIDIFFLDKEDVKISISNYYTAFVLIKPKNYFDFKEKILKKL